MWRCTHNQHLCRRFKCYIGGQAFYTLEIATVLFYSCEEVDIMRDKTYHIYLDSHERKLLIHSLVELKNQLIQQGRYTDCIDELIFKVINAPTKRMKIEYV